MTEPQIAAGWYPDPEDSSQQRWWDGSGWSDQRQPAQAAAPALSVVAGTPAAVAAPRGGDAPSAGKALAAGILALLFNVLFIPSILALRWAKATRGEIAASGGALGGAGKATFARIAGWLGVAFGLLGILAAVVIIGAGGAVVAEAAKDGDYVQQVTTIMERSNATVEGLDTTDPKPAETSAAMTSLQADIAAMEAITPPDKLAADHDKLVGGMRTMVAGLDQVNKADALPMDQSFKALAAGIDKFVAGQTQMLDAATAIDSKTL